MVHEVVEKLSDYVNMLKNTIAVVDGVPKQRSQRCLREAHGKMRPMQINVRGLRRQELQKTKEFIWAKKIAAICMWVMMPIVRYERHKCMT